MRIRAAALAALMTAVHATAVTCQVAASSTNTDTVVRAAIERGNQEYIAALALSDSAAYARVYAPDATRMAEKGRYTKGRDAIAAVVGAMLRQTGPIQATIETADLWVVNDIAYETGKWRYVYTPPGRSTQTVSGRYVAAWKEQSDGSWRIFADISVPGTAW